MARRLAPTCRSTLPKIPGIYRSYTEVKDKYPIGYDLEVVDNVMFIKSIGRARDERPCTDPDVAMAMRAKGYDMVEKRPWMVLDKEMLCFDAYYKHDVLGGHGKTKYAVRKLKINYFLVDNTIRVDEPAEPNSGTTQGCLIKRQRIPLPGCDRDAGPYYKLSDLNVGDAVTFYGKRLIITGVDRYTRDFLDKTGVSVSDDRPIPDDPYYAHGTEVRRVRSLTESARDRRPPDGLDGLILRFRGYWDDRYESEGELRFYEVLYYVADGTMELVEELTDDNRPEAITRKTFVRRQRLPMNGPWCVSPGFDARREILNVLPDRLNSYYYKMDSRVLDDPPVTYYRCTDLFVGATLNVYSRRIVLVKCDRLTEDFYRTVYGLENFEPIEAPKTLREIEEDQLNKKRVEIILKNHDEVLRKRLIKRGATGMVFAFIIKMVTNDPINKKRDFMLKYYLDDTDFAVYEYRETNSGIRGGTFRSKRGFDKTQSERKRFVFHQLAVGVEITIDDFEFVITDADDKTLRFMIDNPDEFPHSDLATLKSKTLETIVGRFASLDEFRAECFRGRELVDRDEFRNIVSFGGALGPHVGVVFALMHKRPDPFEPFTDHVLRSVVQDALRKAQFIHFDGLKSNFKSRSSIPGRHGTSYARREESVKAMKSNKVPLSWEIINILFDKFTDAEHDGGVDYVAMVDFMDYVTDPVELPVGLARELLFVKPKKVLVRANEFVDALRPTTTTTAATATTTTAEA